MSGAVLKFPVLASLRRAADPEPLPSDSVDRRNVSLFLETTTYVVESAKILVDILADHRKSLRQVGIEAVIVELSGILASGRLENIRESLEEAAKTGKPAHLTLEGLSYLKRAERLVAEASMGIARLTGAMAPGMALGGNFSLGQAGGDNKPLISGELLILGLVAIIALTIVVISLSKK